MSRGPIIWAMLIIGAIFTLFVAGCASTAPPRDGQPDGIACTADARVCPDGSAVGRVPPSCEFAPCPGEDARAVPPPNADVVCTMDAKLCPDGSYVGRIGPDCRFAPCPGEAPVSSSITSFSACAQAGYPVMESYPRQCRTPDGRTFVEDVPPVRTP